ncbi:hypothetical protein OAU50_02220 [Planctomycetota bacterium]|nr:hypothetical protein [Planctomycetota bacterium]
MSKVCYNSDADKGARFKAETLPLIADTIAETFDDFGEYKTLRAWLRENEVMGKGRAGTLERLHNAARAGIYLSVRQANCDIIQPVSRTLESGGDCDQWATALIAALTHLGYSRKYLVAVGDSKDPLQHISTVASRDGIDFWYLDPKPNQTGVLFNRRADNLPIIRFWQYDHNTRKFSRATLIGAYRFSQKRSA